jgi:large subunit ribosomal protein L19
MQGLQGIIHQVEAKYLKNRNVQFKSGDTVKVSMKVKEREKERVQIFEGTVIARGGSGIKQTFRVRRISHGVGVERIFPLHSPSLVKIQIVKHGAVRRGKLFYLRDKSGKDARIQQERRKTEEIVVPGIAAGESDSAAVPVAK